MSRHSWRELGLGRFKMVARDGEIIYLRRAGDAGQQGSKSHPSTCARATTEPEAQFRHCLNSPSPSPPSPTPAYKPGYGKSWAVVIGINEYQKWPKLKYAVNDARSMGDVLHKIGFDEVIMLLDSEATQQKILRVLGDDLHARTQDDDRVFIFFAGHGQTQDLPNNSKMGYIIPVEGEMNNYYSTAISMRQFQDVSDRLRAKHIFFALDSCFSGLLLRLPELLRLRGGVPDAYAGMEQTTAAGMRARCPRLEVKASRWVKCKATASSPTC